MLSQTKTIEELRTENAALRCRPASLGRAAAGRDSLDSLEKAGHSSVDAHYHPGGARNDQSAATLATKLATAREREAALERRSGAQMSEVAG